MNTPISVANALKFMAEWSEGFALVFVFDDARNADELDVELVWYGDCASTADFIDEVAGTLATANRPVVISFDYCDQEVVLTALALLNERRTLLEQLRHTVIIACERAGRIPVAEACPDLWHVRTIIPDSD